MSGYFCFLSNNCKIVWDFETERKKIKDENGKFEISGCDPLDSNYFHKRNFPMWDVSKQSRAASHTWTAVGASIYMSVCHVPGPMYTPCANRVHVTVHTQAKPSIHLTLKTPGMSITHSTIYIKKHTAAFL